MSIARRQPLFRRFRSVGVPAFVFAMAASGLGADAAHAQGGAGAADSSTPWPMEPPARICGNAAVLDGPATPPGGAIVVPAGDNSGFDFNRPGATFWFAPGVHTLGDDLYGQIIARDGATYVGAPGAVIDGRNLNLYAFTGTATNVTIRHLTIRNFGRGLDNNNEGVVNHDAGDGWLIEYNTVVDNDGAGVFLGSGNTVRYNCLKDNGQYGFSMFKMPVEGGPAITGIELDHNEIAGNNTDDWEVLEPGCGCSGGGKFWDVQGARVTNNWVHDNKSVGLWADTNNIDFLFEGNYIENNDDEGIWYEISYNATIRGNALINNAWVKGLRNQGSPAPAIYLSESGGDSRLSTATSGAARIRVHDNYFENNFSGVSIYENTNRFCNSNGNTSKGYCTPFVTPTLIPGPHDYDYVDPINAAHPCYTRIAEEPYRTDCRWHARNIEVVRNEFHFDPDVVPCEGADYCGVQALIATGADNLPWSPYTVAEIQEQVMFNAGNRFAENRYFGPWQFAKRWGERIGFAAWQVAPYLQDTGSTSDQSGGPGPGPVGNLVDADTATLEGSLGSWGAWYGAEVARSDAQAHGGGYSLRVDVVDAYWGVEVANYPGYAASPGNKSVSVWVRGGVGNPVNPRLVLDWRAGDGQVLDTSVLALPVQEAGWQSVDAVVQAPAGAATVSVVLVGTGSAGTSFYLDDLQIEDAQP
ncbi:right-handed parallel beta-helix repeat-containing protein [Marilutibacter chinensis]|uniref:Right-handed parallel beta-helix repeat-containing protein n=1 Tax=Marilutibacter chinensis TaxID=2912247 RepID=A0ABS9HR21_9GAMM|nr:right-handed parallel beta-helix repeat-containing protein [Lysobacter chinensis]MCF7220577.1 right-handed parallel beta-helix repeat-containing protein [Lysobacter chinensis]